MIILIEILYLLKDIIFAMSTKHISNKYSKWYLARCNKDQYTPDKKFVRWIDCVELQVYETLGVSLLDLPDESYFINFEDGISSKDMADQVITGNCYLVLNNAHK